MKEEADKGQAGGRKEESSAPAATNSSGQAKQEQQQHTEGGAGHSGEEFGIFLPPMRITRHQSAHLNQDGTPLVALAGQGSIEMVVDEDAAHRKRKAEDQPAAGSAEDGPAQAAAAAPDAKPSKRSKAIPTELKQLLNTSIHDVPKTAVRSPAMVTTAVKTTSISAVAAVEPAKTASPRKPVVATTAAAAAAVPSRQGSGGSGRGRAAASAAAAAIAAAVAGEEKEASPAQEAGSGGGRKRAARSSKTAANAAIAAAAAALEDKPATATAGAATAAGKHGEEGAAPKTEEKKRGRGGARGGSRAGSTGASAAVAAAAAAAVATAVAADAGAAAAVAACPSNGLGRIPAKPHPAITIVSMVSIMEPSFAAPAPVILSKGPAVKAVLPVVRYTPGVAMVQAEASSSSSKLAPVMTAQRPKNGSYRQPYGAYTVINPELPDPVPGWLLLGWL